MAPGSSGIPVRIAAVVTCCVDTSIRKVYRILRSEIIRSHRPRTTRISIHSCTHRPRVLMPDVRCFAFLAKYNIHTSRFVKCPAGYAQWRREGLCPPPGQTSLLSPPLPQSDILMVTTMAIVWIVNSTLSWGCIRNASMSHCQS